MSGRRVRWQPLSWRSGVGLGRLKTPLVDARELATLAFEHGSFRAIEHGWRSPKCVNLLSSRERVARRATCT
jgi:hypothetical protein